MQPLIDHITRFVKLNSEDIRLLERVCSQHSFPSKATMIEHGNVCHAAHFVIRGCFRTYFVHKSGIEKTVHFAIEDWWITDYDSFLNQKPSQLNIQSIENCETIKITRQGWQEIHEKSYHLSRYFQIIMEKTFVAAQRRIHFMFNLSGEELYDVFMARNPDFANRVPQYMLASYLGFTPEFMSRIRKKKSKSH
ncbi:MAG: Crp/Fnr family transcriptional regulator [Cyclobacteriaceae bacterium]